MNPIFASVRGAVRRALPVTALCGCVLLGLGARAQTVMVYEPDHLPSAQEVADILSRGASENIKLRGLASAGDKSPFALLEQKATRTMGEATALSVPIPFDFDSSNLSARAKQQVDVIAEGIRLTEGTIKVVIEGHTDAKGGAKYNERLSYRRALAVQTYLVNTKNLPVKLLSVEGKGPHKPLNQADPYSPANRRVQFRAG